MATIARTLAALALASTALVGPPVRPAHGLIDEPDVLPPPSEAPRPPIGIHGVGDRLADDVRAFKAEKFREIDEAILELRELIDERARALAAMEAELRDAREELAQLEALSALRNLDITSARTPFNTAPAVLADDPGATASPPRPAEHLPGTFDAVVPTSAAVVEPAWRGLLRIAGADGGPLVIQHSGGDGTGAVEAGALRADVIEIRVGSAPDARVIAHSLKADGRPVVSWPELRKLPESSADPRRIEALETSLQRLAEAVDRLDRRTSTAPDPAHPAPVLVEPPDEIPPAPAIPD